MDVFHVLNANFVEHLRTAVQQSPSADLSTLFAAYAAQRKRLSSDDAFLKDCERRLQKHKASGVIPSEDVILVSLPKATSSDAMDSDASAIQQKPSPKLSFSESAPSSAKKSLPGFGSLRDSSPATEAKDKEQNGAVGSSLKTLTPSPFFSTTPSKIASFSSDNSVEPSTSLSTTNPFPSFTVAKSETEQKSGKRSHQSTEEPIAPASVFSATSTASATTPFAFGAPFSSIVPQKPDAPVVVAPVTTSSPSPFNATPSSDGKGKSEKPAFPSKAPLIDTEPPFSSTPMESTASASLTKKDTIVSNFSFPSSAEALNKKETTPQPSASASSTTTTTTTTATPSPFAFNMGTSSTTETKTSAPQFPVFGPTSTTSNDKAAAPLISSTFSSTPSTTTSSTFTFGAPSNSFATAPSSLSSASTAPKPSPFSFSLGTTTTSPFGAVPALPSWGNSSTTTAFPQTTASATNASTSNDASGNEPDSEKADETDTGVSKEKASDVQDGDTLVLEKEVMMYVAKMVKPADGEQQGATKMEQKPLGKSSLRLIKTKDGETDKYLLIIRPTEGLNIFVNTWMQSWFVKLMAKSADKILTFKAPKADSEGKEFDSFTMRTRTPADADEILEAIKKTVA